MRHAPTAAPGRDAAERRMFRFLDATPSIRSPPVASRHALRAHEGGVVVRRVSEFGTINADHLGRPYRYCYSFVPEPGWFLFRGSAAPTSIPGPVDDWLAGDGVFVSEAPLAPRRDSGAPRTTATSSR